MIGLEGVCKVVILNVISWVRNLGVCFFWFICVCMLIRFGMIYNLERFMVFVFVGVLGVLVFGLV